MPRFLFGLAAIFTLTAPAIATSWVYGTTVGELRFTRGADGVHIYPVGGAGDGTAEGCDRTDVYILPLTSATPKREEVMLVGLMTADIGLIGCMGGIGGVSYPVVYYIWSK